MLRHVRLVTSWDVCCCSAAGLSGWLGTCGVWVTEKMIGSEGDWSGQLCGGQGQEKASTVPGTGVRAGMWVSEASLSKRPAGGGTYSEREERKRRGGCLFQLSPHSWMRTG